MIGELYTILWQRSGSAEWFPLTARVERIVIWKSVEAAQKALDEDRLPAEAVPHGVEKIEIFPLNSPEAFQAIFGEPGIQFEEEPREVAMSRFQFAAEPLMRESLNDAVEAEARCTDLRVKIEEVECKLVAAKEAPTLAQRIVREALFHTTPDALRAAITEVVG